MNLGLRLIAGTLLVVGVALRLFGSTNRGVLVWDFDRIIVGHGEWVERNAKHTMAAAFGKFLGLGS